MTALYSTKARVSGGRSGRARTDDGLLDVNLALPKAFGGTGDATNPEQLFAAGYAACFESALRLVAGKQKAPLQDAAVTATVELLPNGDGFRLGVGLEVETTGLDAETAEKVVATAHQICPYSNAVRGNIDVALSVKAG